MSAIAEFPPFASVADAGVCNWFFAMFVLVSVYFGLILLANLTRVSFLKIPVLPKIFLLVLAIAATGIVIGNAGFQFTMCKRALAV